MDTKIEEIFETLGSLESVECTLSLLSQISDRTADPRSIPFLREFGAPILANKILATSIDPTVISQCTHILSQLASSSFETKSSMCDIISTLISTACAQQSNEDLFCEIVRLVGSLAECDECVVPVQSCDGIPAMLTLLDNDRNSERMTLTLLEALQNIADDVDNKVTIRNSSGVQILLNVIQRNSDNSELIQTAMSVLANVAEDAKAKGMIKDLGGIQVLLNCAKRYVDQGNVLKECMLVLAVACEKNDPNRIVVQELNGIPFLFECIAKYRSENDVLLDILAVLLHLSQNGVNQVLINEQGGLDLLAEIFESQNETNEITRICKDISQYLCPFEEQEETNSQSSQTQQKTVTADGGEVVDVENWSPVEVAEWLKTIFPESTSEYQEYSAKFLQHKISGKILTKLTDSDLKNEIEISAFGDRSEILEGISKLKPGLLPMAYVASYCIIS